MRSNGDGGDMSPPVKFVVPPSEEKYFVLGGDAKTSPPVISRVKSLNVFHACSLCVSTAGDALHHNYLVVIMT